MGTLLTLRTSLRGYTNKSSTVLTDALCDECVTAAQERMEQAHRWREQEQSWDFTYGATDDGKALPSGFISELVVSYEDSAQTDPSLALTPLPRLAGGRIAWLLSRGPQVVRDSYYPQAAALSYTTLDREYYYIWGGSVFIVPQPGSDKDYQLDYYGLADVLEEGVTESNFFTNYYYNALKWGALVEAWSILHEGARAAASEAVFEKNLARAVKHDQSVAMSGPPRSRGT